MFKFIVLIAIVIFVGPYLYIMYTDLPWAEDIRKGRCEADNGIYNKETDECIGGSYGPFNSYKN